jgi:SAM-dependent methyltransferase
MSRMARYWDRRARENPFYFVDNRLVYGDPDLERFWAGGEETVDELLGALGEAIDPGDVVVEIGCGVGRLTRPIAKRAREVHAIDVSQRMLDLAAENNPELGNVRWMPGDGETLTGTADGSADACVSFVVLQHLPDPSITLRYVREMGRVLRGGGWAAFQVSNDPSIHRRRPLRERLEVALRAATRRGPRGQADPAWRGSAVDLEELAATASDSGMDVERVVGEGTQFCLVLLRRRPRES